MGGHPDPFDSPKWDRPPAYPRVPISGTLVAVMDWSRRDRGLLLIPQRSRCLRRHEVHELILTDDDAAAPRGRVDRVAYIGFVELGNGGLLGETDEVLVGGKLLGTVAGFDETHMPNHLNIVLRGDGLRPGSDRGYALGDPVMFRPAAPAA